MSLRDYFAGQALAGLSTLTKVWCGAGDRAATACLAYQIADAMLEARK
jgi:hypothetical protein